MSGNFNYNAPQYVDLTSAPELELQEYADDYFDMDHEVVLQYNEEVTENKNSDIDLSIEDVIEIDNTHNMQYYNENKENRPNLRRSMSAGNIAIDMISNEILEQNVHNIEDNLCQAVKALEFSSKRKTKVFDGIAKDVFSIKPNVLYNQKNRYTFSNKPRSMCNSRENLNKINMNNSLRKKLSAEDLRPSKFISAAEFMNKYQFKTPDRFHSKPKTNQLVHIKQQPLSRTIPQSPLLLTKKRERPVYYVSHEQQEKETAKEMKKFHLKAQPIDHKIFKTPVLHAKVDKKPVTVPEPFNITEIKMKKPSSPKPEVFDFHARPAPKNTGPPMIKQNILPSTIAITPTFMKIRKYKQDKLPAFNENGANNKVCLQNVDMHHDGIGRSTKPVKTKVEPFSFERRNKLMQEKKEEKIKKYLEGEKKKREFHARPIPAQKGPVQSKFNQSRDKNVEHVQPDVESVIFKARPASVVHKKPFIPKKEQHLIEINEFSLSTELRAKERREYDKKLKEKEEELDLLRTEHTKNVQKHEKEIIAQIRKETVHKANPVPHYKILEIQPSNKKLTYPSSPAFIKRLHKQDNDSTGS